MPKTKTEAPVTAKRPAPVPKSDEAAQRQIDARTKPRVSARDFVRAFQTSNSYRECASTLGVSVATIAQRATVMRKRGVNLKSMRTGGGSRINADMLNDLISEIDSEDDVVEDDTADVPAVADASTDDDAALEF